MNARDFGVADDPLDAAREDVEPYLDLPPRERYARFLDLMAFTDRIWNALDPEQRRRYERINDQLDDPGRWWERVPGGSGRIDILASYPQLSEEDLRAALRCAAEAVSRFDFVPLPVKS